MHVYTKYSYALTVNEKLLREQQSLAYLVKNCFQNGSDLPTFCHYQTVQCRKEEKEVRPIANSTKACIVVSGTEAPRQRVKLQSLNLAEQTHNVGDLRWARPRVLDKGGRHPVHAADERCEDLL
mmetsp:Transcript_25028/g.70745  ORF Transcript_25028/g.70745 Transcript_25028/m.70745 type:complete len:124 (-) Transcript_25028:119-490(-)